MVATTEGRVVVLEFNELSPSLMERFIRDGDLPNFERLYSESLVFTTEAAERPPYLEPWIQWVTVHTGLNYRDHGIYALDEGHTLQAERTWDVVSAAGSPVLVWGSMSLGYRAPIRGIVVPDPWTTKLAPVPETLTSYFRFIQRHVMEHTGERAGLTVRDYARFIGFMLRHGLSLGTAASMVGQLVGERLGPSRWKRASGLDRLQFDAFRSCYRRVRPRLATFFSNSTAHYQHFHWREMEPDKFKIKPSHAEMSTYRDTILFGYRAMDDLVGRFLGLIDADTTLVLCTALSQQPCLLYDDAGGKVLYRARDLAALLRFAGVSSHRCATPVMAEEFILTFETEQDASAAERGLRALSVAGQSALLALRRGTRIHSGCKIFHPLPGDTRLSVDGTQSSAPFFDLFYQVEGTKSGMHHPDGIFWIRTPARTHAVERERVPLAAVAPTILRLLSLSCPSQMAEAHHMGVLLGVLRGCDVDQSRNLAKRVTAE